MGSKMTDFERFRFFTATEASFEISHQKSHGCWRPSRRISIPIFKGVSQPQSPVEFFNRFSPKHKCGFIGDISYFEFLHFWICWTLLGAKENKTFKKVCTQTSVFLDGSLT